MRANPAACPFLGHDGNARRIAIWEVLFAVAVALCCGDVPGTAIDQTQYGQYADRRIGICNGQLCYSNRTVAGVTPPLAEALVGSFLPVFVRHGMASNLAGYTVAAIPLWPLLVLTGWPVVRWLLQEWAARHRFQRDRHRVGFAPIMLASRAADSPEDTAVTQSE